MVEINIKYDDQGLGNKLKGKAIDVEVNKLLSDIIDIAEKWSNIKVPVKTGKLKSKITTQKAGTSGAVFVPTGSVKYFDFVIDGTRPHDIFPVKGQALYWPGASHPVRSVHHPGTKPNPFFDKAVSAMDGEVERRLERFTKWLEEL